MRGRFPRVSDRAIGILLGILLGIAVILAFLFLSSRNTIDEPSLSGGATQTQPQPAAPPAKVSKPKPPQ
ncbi:MAG: hypothetical protein QOD14_1865 [Solirubrobacterales bacterium]|jgi:hypothetical protein|nr:hypothetical protein [Solirubrobacterales bacterium]